ncbi:MAG: hypothetical protein N2690_11245, partial [Rhodocyclaceae bacterium]|nr:hypothetical protein [Rhodocyclaceae bacterium]
VRGEFVQYAAGLARRYHSILPANNGAKPSHDDYLALALAKQESCTLLTGDANLRIVAKMESVEVMGTIGLLCAMIENQLLTVDEAIEALHKMKAGKRRLPWHDAEKMLEALR